MRRPVCRLNLALYGHPQSGAFWEEHAAERLISEDWLTIEGWPSCYWHKEFKAFMVLYVDDFKISGPKTRMREAWESVMRHIVIDAPTKMKAFLGSGYLPIMYTPPRKKKIKAVAGPWQR